MDRTLAQVAQGDFGVSHVGVTHLDIVLSNLLWIVQLEQGDWTG